MSVQTNDGPGQDPAAGTPQQGQAPGATQQHQQGTGQQQPTGQAPGQEQQGGQEFDPSSITDPTLRAWAEKQASELARARQEAAQYRTAKSAAEQQVQQFRQQHETDAERQQREQQERDAETERLRQENRALKVGGAIQTAATKAQAFNPALVAQMLDARVSLDAEGKPTNVDALLAELRQSDPYLFRAQPGTADAGAGRQQQPGAGTPGEGGVNDFIRSRGRGVSPAIR